MIQQNQIEFIVIQQDFMMKVVPHLKVQILIQVTDGMEEMDLQKNQELNILMVNL